MNVIKKAIPLLLAMALFFALSLSALAAEEIPPDTGTILIKSGKNVDASRRVFAAYKVLDLRAFYPEGCIHFGHQYSVPSSMVDVYERLYGLDKTAANFAYQVSSCLDGEEDLSRILAEINIRPLLGRPVEGGYEFDHLPLGCYIVVDITAEEAKEGYDWGPQLAVVAPDAVLYTTFPSWGTVSFYGSDKYDISPIEFLAYPILDLDYSTDETGEVTSEHYTVRREWTDFFAARYGLDSSSEDFHQQVFQKVAELRDFEISLNRDNLRNLCMDVLKEATEEPYVGALSHGKCMIEPLPMGCYVLGARFANGYTVPIDAVFLNMFMDRPEYSVDLLSWWDADLYVDGDNDPSTTEDGMTYHVADEGELLTYVIRTEVPVMQSYEPYLFSVSSGLSAGIEFSGDVNVRLAGEALTEGIDYEVTSTELESGATRVEIVFKDFGRFNDPAYFLTPIVISYTATLDPLTEEAYCSYSNGGEMVSVYFPEGKSPEEGLTLEELEKLEDARLRWRPLAETQTFTTGLEFIASDPIGNRLGGAKLALTGEDLHSVTVQQDYYHEYSYGEYWKLKNGSYTTIAPGSYIDGAYVDPNNYESLTVKYIKETDIWIVDPDENGAVADVTGMDGVLRFFGVGTGAFRVESIKAPNGYNECMEYIDIEVCRDEDTGAVTYRGALEENGMGRNYVVYQIDVELDKTQLDPEITLKHSLNLTEDISINYLVPEAQLEGYDMDTVYLQISLPIFEGNSEVDHEYVRLLPEKRENYYYFVLDGLTAVQMGDDMVAELYGMRDDMCYVSHGDRYSVCEYAMAQMNKDNASAKLKTLCANLLRYGALAQSYKSYRSDALADRYMTEQHRSYLTALDSVTFSNNQLELSNGSGLPFTWIGKGLNLGSRVGLTFRFREKSGTASYEDWRIRVQYRDGKGQLCTCEIPEEDVIETVENGVKYYSFTFSDLSVCELRNVVCFTVVGTDNTLLSSNLIYSAESYCYGKTGTLGDVCKALFAYSDSARAFFTE